MNSKKPKFAKKAKDEVEKQAEPIATPRKLNNGHQRKRNSPSQGNVVTVAVFPSGSDNNTKEDNPGNVGILDENGRLILKVEHNQGKKQIKEEDYITAAEIANDKNSQNDVVDSEDENVIKEDDVEENENSQDIEISESNNVPRKEKLTDEHTDDEQIIEESEVKESVKEEANEETSAEETVAEESEPEETTEKESEQEESPNIEKLHSVVPSDYKSPEGGPKTVGFYHFDVEPVVGWLVCVTGQIKGKSFKLKSGQNIIGDSGIMDVYLPAKEKRKGEAQAILIFEPIKKEFMLRVTGAIECSVNEKKIESYVALKNYDIIKIDEYKLVFKALCSEKFDWKDYE